MNNQAINVVAEDFTYQEMKPTVFLELSSGETAELDFGKSSVKVKDSHLYDDKDEIFEILLFIRSYTTERDINLQRTNTSLYGEYRLHAILYQCGYKETSTKDLDLEYVSDPRWYVNVCSAIIGWLGI